MHKENNESYWSLLKLMLVIGESGFRRRLEVASRIKTLILLVHEYDEISVGGIYSPSENSSGPRHVRSSSPQTPLINKNNVLIAPHPRRSAYNNWEHYHGLSLVRKHLYPLSIFIKCVYWKTPRQFTPYSRVFGILINRIEGSKRNLRNYNMGW